MDHRSIEAFQRVNEYLRLRDVAGFTGMGDIIHALHIQEGRAELRLSDMKLVAAALGQATHRAAPSIDLSEGQIWRPTNGEPTRQIERVFPAGIPDVPHPLGTLLVTWVVNAGKWGTCSAKSFRGWATKTKAIPSLPHHQNA